MPYQFTVSPDFSPDHISGWYIFNTWLQKAINEHIHLELYNDFASQRDAISADNVDLIYANPYDATTLVREKGFLPIAKPCGKPDEAIVVVKHDHPAQSVEELQPGITISCTDDPDVSMIGAIMLEPADLYQHNTQRRVQGTYPLVAKDLIRGEADVGFFLAEAFEDLTGITRRSLRPLVSSQIHVIQHVLLGGPKILDQREKISNVLIGMPQMEKGPGVLEALGLKGWETVDDEETEFMIDLMETLTWQPD